MSKRNSIYEHKLKMLLSDLSPLDGLSALNIRLRKFGRCMNVVELNEVFGKLKESLRNDVIDMDDCLDYGEWCDEDKWAFKRETPCAENDICYDVKSLINRMQDYKPDFNSKISIPENREKIQTSLSIISSRIFMPDEELDEIFYNGIKKLKDVLKYLYEKTPYKTWTSEAFINLSQKYKCESEKKWVFLNRLRRDFQDWKNHQLDIELDDLIDYRGKLILRLLNCELCSCCDKDFKIKDTDRHKFLEEMKHCSPLTGMDDILLKRYAYLRRIFSFDGKLYRMVNVEKLGKHIYMNRMNLTDDEIYEFFLLINIVNVVQNDMTFDDVRPDDDDRVSLAWYNLRQADIVDYQNQPINLSLEEKGVLAKELANALKIKKVWAHFAEIWNMDKESLRKAYERNMNKDGTGDLIIKYQKAIGLD